MKINKIVAGMVAGVMAASVMSIGASATVAYNWTLHKSYGQPTSTVVCSGNILSLDSSRTNINFVCNDMSNNYADVQLDLTISNMKYDYNEKATLYYENDTDTIALSSSWYSYYKNAGYKCPVNGYLINDTSTTYTAEGTAS